MLAWTRCCDNQFISSGSQLRARTPKKFRILRSCWSSSWQVLCAEGVHNSYSRSVFVYCTACRLRNRRFWNRNLAPVYATNVCSEVLLLRACYSYRFLVQNQRVVAAFVNVCKMIRRAILTCLQINKFRITQHLAETLEYNGFYVGFKILR